jgi:cytochrome c2
MKMLQLALAMTLAAAFGTGLVSPQQAAADQKVFESKKCTQCHSIQALGVQKVAKKDGTKRKGPDLSGTGLKKYDNEVLAAFMKKEGEKKSVYKDEKVKHKKKYKGTDADLNKLVAFLQTQKSDIKVEDDGAGDDDEGDDD